MTTTKNVAIYMKFLELMKEKQENIESGTKCVWGRKKLKLKIR
jgi:hypothetical protein